MTVALALLNLITGSYLFQKVLRSAGAGLLAGGLLWGVVAHLEPQHGTMIMHVLEPDVEVSVDDQRFYFERPTSEPLVLRLPSGRHTFRVCRGDAVLINERFSLRGGASQVLAAVSDR